MCVRFGLVTWHGGVRARVCVGMPITPQANGSEWRGPARNYTRQLKSGLLEQNL
jgi:hypothetical protein